PERNEVAPGRAAACAASGWPAGMRSRPRRTGRAADRVQPSGRMQRPPPAWDWAEKTVRMLAAIRREHPARRRAVASARLDGSGNDRDKEPGQAAICTTGRALKSIPGLDEDQKFHYKRRSGCSTRLRRQWERLHQL